jgi:hypothetical protein
MDNVRPAQLGDKQLGMAPGALTAALQATYG